MNAMEMEQGKGGGDRKTTHGGCTAKAKVVYDAELASFSCFENLLLGLSCVKFEKERSYLLVREGSVESNFSIAPCCGLFPPIDYTRVMHYDVAPLTRDPSCFDCLMSGSPKFEVVKSGCMCCCKECVFDDTVVIVPFDNFCCCCPNHSKKTCFGLFGPLPNNPGIYFSFYPQPEDKAAFCTAATQVMEKAPKRK